MLRSLKKKIFGTIDISDIQKFLKNNHPTVSNDVNKFLDDNFQSKRFEKSQLDYEDFTGQFTASIGGIVNQKSKYNQLIYLREIALNTLEDIAGCQYFLDDENGAGSIGVVSRNHSIFDGLSVEGVYEKSSTLAVEKSWLFTFTRTISKRFFEDAAEFDYAKLYLDICGQIEKHENDIDIEEAGGESGSTLFEAFLPHLHQMKLDIRRNVLEGGNYDSTPTDDDLEDDEEEEEEEFEKLRTITDDQYTRLKQIFFERVDLFNRDELYSIDGHTPDDIGAVIRFDTGLMLIALSECIDDIELCKRTIKNLMIE